LFVFHFHRDTIVGKSDSLPKIDGGRITDQDIGSDSFAALPWIIFEPLDYAAANTFASHIALDEELAKIYAIFIRPIQSIANIMPGASYDYSAVIGPKKVGHALFKLGYCHFVAMVLIANKLFIHSGEPRYIGLISKSEL